ncbi:dUTP diphosphatase [Planococcus plakortidis]
MEFAELFNMQRKLDAEIEKNHPALPNENRLKKQLVALLVELSEAANDWRGFKYWSTNQQAKDTLLEEYCDVLHFFLSIGNRLRKDGFPVGFKSRASEDIESCLLDIYEQVPQIEWNGYCWYVAFYRFIELGNLLGFDWKQISEAYLVKNQVNWERQGADY